ncbi:MAG: RNA polymerase factor sigma-54 [Pseudorhodoplanes sp.]|nr:RNA polymerase factor sigma-54 [Pseudorhodoplanes sp.]
MALTTRLEFRQTQALVMTPQLMQAIKLLQLSNLDLAAYVEQELERNPLLERAGDNDAAASELEPTDAEPAFAAEEGSGGDEWMGGELETSRGVIEEQLGTRLDNVFPDDAGQGAGTVRQDDTVAVYSEWASVGSGGRDDPDYNLEAFVSAEQTLAEHLAEQLALAVSDPARRMIGQYLIDLVDETGYISGDLAVIADRLGAPLAEVETVLEILQTFEPAGVCARSLTECLAIQLRERDRLDPAMQAMLVNLDLVARRDYASLRKLCAVGDEDLADMIAEIRRLNPKPGLAFGSTSVQPIVPDVFVRQVPDGTFAVELNSDTLPKVLLNQSYHARVSKTAANAQDKSYLAEQLQSATWLIRALDQRARTILKVATEIVKQQDAFFTHGVQHLRPLNLKTVADAISMHESTVSRVTANKYMATSRGIFELKYFFTSAIAAADGGEAHSAESVRHRIKIMIDAEAPEAILSDDMIVDKLRESGIDIARRTVAKYREAMRIPSSVQRRRDKQAVALVR